LVALITLIEPAFDIGGPAFELARSVRKLGLWFGGNWGSS